MYIIFDKFSLYIYETMKIKDSPTISIFICLSIFFYCMNQKLFFILVLWPLCHLNEYNNI